MESYIYKDKNNFNTNMYKLMQEFKIKDLNSKWLITDIETNEDEIFNKEYIIINHQNLIELLKKIQKYSGYGLCFPLYLLNIVMMKY